MVGGHNAIIRLQFASEPIGKDQSFWNNGLCTEDSRLNSLFGHSNSKHVCCRPKTAFQEKNFIPIVRHGDGYVMDLVALLPQGLGQLAVIDSTMNSASYQRELEVNVRQSV